MSDPVSVEVVGRNPKNGTLWLRVPYRRAHRIVRVSDDVLPYGLKTADRVSARVTGVRPVRSGWTADVEVMR